MNQRVVLLFCAVLTTVVVTACSKDEQPEEKRPSPFDTQMQALEKAKQADKLIQDTDARRRQEIEDSAN